MKNLLFAVVVLAAFAFVSGCCCKSQCTASGREIIPVPAKAEYAAAAGSAVAAAAQAEKVYDWQIFPAYMAPADADDAVKMVGIVDGEGYLIWDYARTEEDFAKIIPVYAKDIKKAFDEVKADIDASGSAVSKGIDSGKNLVRTCVFAKVTEDALIPVEAADGQYFVMVVEFARD